METNKVKDGDDSEIIPLWAVGMLVFGVWLGTSFISYYIILNFFGLVNWENKGQFGDMFGAVNSLFSGLAFAGLIYTILLQRKELKSTRKDFEEQRNISIFFNMIENHRGLVNSFLEQVPLIRNSTQDVDFLSVKGYEYINKKTNQLKSEISNIDNLLKNKNSNYAYFYRKRPKKILESYTDLTQIFSSIKSIIEFINKFLYNEKIYHEILFNILSGSERYILNKYTVLNINNSAEKISYSSFNYLDQENDIFEKDYNEIPNIEFVFPNNNFLLESINNQRQVISISISKSR